MIWRKSWWECRARVFWAAFAYVAVSCMALVFFSNPPTAKNALATWNLFSILLACFVTPIITVLLAGSGINSQTAWGMFQGFHASMYFLLSMPVSRRRALLVRSALGAIFTVLFVLLSIGTVALGVRLLGAGVPIARVFGSIPFMLIDAFGFYGLSTFLCILLDEFWAGMLGMGITGLLFGMEVGFWVLPIHFKPAQILSGELFLSTGVVGWPVIVFFLLMGVSFLAASVYLVERREY